MRNSIGSDTAPYTHQPWGGRKGKGVPAQANVARIYLSAWQLTKISQRTDGHQFGTQTTLFGYILVLFLSVDRFPGTRTGNKVQKATGQRPESTIYNG